ncbi:cysteine-rich receptor-like protein kinase 25 [Sorghum bicolor]|nr:cysteine-rich receptor-like protein kinase 25 [Sorghum bicolor]|eukprot:XP_021302092.1 cysteine-rich receptor-like protein kinase 25 [Sorghum bicolor]
MAPEYLQEGKISTKSDIYSLGILILEIVTGKKNPQVEGNMSGQHFIENVRKNWTKMSQIVSKHPLLGTYSHHQVYRCIEIGLRCVEVNPEKRPSAGEILLHIFYGNPHVKISLMHSLRGMLMRTAAAIPRRSLRPPEPGSSSSWAPTPRAAFDPFDVDSGPPRQPELMPEQMTVVRFCLFCLEANHGCCYWVALVQSIRWGI